MFGEVTASFFLLHYIYHIVLFNIFLSIIIKGSVADDGAQEILKQLDESSTKQSLKTVTGGVLIDMENTDMYGKWLGASYTHFQLEEQVYRSVKYIREGQGMSQDKNM